ncbi:MAG: hypothetical protein ACRYGP_17580 [Janthinobacterium lividum]
MSAVLTRRSALRGSAAAALGLAASVGMARAATQADAALIIQADAFRSLCARENQAWHDISEEDQVGETPALTACRALSQACRDAGDVLADMPARTPEGLAAKASVMLALTGPRLDTQAALSEHEELVVSILRDAARLAGGVHV